MISKRFSVGLVLRVALLTAAAMGFSLAFIQKGFPALSLLCGLAVVVLVFELYRYVSRTNQELARFLAAARYGDFSQRFHRPDSGAGFAPLAAELADIMQRLKESRQQQEEKNQEQQQEQNQEQQEIVVGHGELLWQMLTMMDI